MSKIKQYYQLTKPGIIKGNVVHVLAGALLASTMGILVEPMLGVLIGTSFVIASACVANNLIDRDIDARMKRTKERASVTGAVGVKSALVYLIALGLIGFTTLAVTTNVAVVWIGVLAYIMYVFVYGYAKRKTTLSTIVGAVPGALPAMAGYVAVSGEVSLGAILVFLVVFTWQMPHFYAISLFRKKDYAAAGIPVLGVVKSFGVVRMHILAFMTAYTAGVIGLISFDVVSPPAGLLLICGAAYWMTTFMITSTKNEDKWARSMFGSSLLLTLILLVASLLNVFVPPLQ